MTATASLRSCSSAETSRFSTTSSLIRRLRHWLLKTLNSISLAGRSLPTTRYLETVLAAMERCDPTLL